MPTRRLLLYLLLAFQVAGQAFPAGLVLCLDADGVVDVEPAGGFRPGAAPAGPVACAGWCEGEPSSPSAGCDGPRLCPAGLFRLESTEEDDCSDLSLSSSLGVPTSGPAAPDGGPETAGPTLPCAVASPAPVGGDGSLSSLPGGPPLDTSPTLFHRALPLRI